MSDCPNCGSIRTSDRCQICGHVEEAKAAKPTPEPEPEPETAEAPAEQETAAKKRPARKHTAEKR